jgi:ketosteroid isomerase-like protein
MSQNVDLVMEGFQRFVAGVEDPAERWYEDGVLTGPEGWPEQGPFHGRAAIRAQFQRLGEDYAETRFTDIEVLADQGEWVVVRFTWRTLGQASDIETAADMAAALRVKDGRFLEGHYRWDVDDAFEAAGLSK